MKCPDCGKGVARKILGKHRGQHKATASRLANKANGNGPSLNTWATTGIQGSRTNVMLNEAETLLANVKFDVRATDAAIAASEMQRRVDFYKRAAASLEDALSYMSDLSVPPKRK
jgi:hypothetical protein